MCGGKGPPSMERIKIAKSHNLSWIMPFILYKKFKQGFSYFCIQNERLLARGLGLYPENNHCQSDHKISLQFS